VSAPAWGRHWQICPCLFRLPVMDQPVGSPSLSLGHSNYYCSINLNFRTTLSLFHCSNSLQRHLGLPVTIHEAGWWYLCPDGGILTTLQMLVEGPVLIKALLMGWPPF
jgi:hypothetical protein